MPVIDKMPGAPFEVWHDGVLVAIVYDNKVLVNATEDVDIVFGEPEHNTWMS